MRPLARRRCAVALAWIGFVALALAVAARSPFAADLSAFLPRTPTDRQRLLIDQLRDGVAARLLLLGIVGGDAEARAAASRALAQALRTSGRFDLVQNGDDASALETDPSGTGRRLFDARYALSPRIDTNRFTVEGLRDAIGEAIGLLASPVGGRFKPVFARDPTAEVVALGETLQPADAPRSDGGVWVSRDGASALLLAHANAAGADLDALAASLALVRRQFARSAAPGLTLEVSGAPAFAVDARARMKHEVARLGGFGLALILALLAIAFGSLRAIALSIVPVLTGVVAGVAAVALGFGTIHGITLGFGTTLIGEAVDYAIYCLVQSRRGGARGWIERAWPTVRVGLATSVCGFGVLIASGFPGLAQLGLFTVAGLSAAAIVTRYGLTTFAPDGAAASRARDRIGAFASRAVPQLARARPAVFVLALVSIAGIAVAGRSIWSGDIAQLSPAPAAAQALDDRLRGELGSADAAHLVTIEAADREHALLGAEAVGRTLDALVDAGAIAGYDSPARFLPSAATQHARRAALPDAATLRTRLLAALQGQPVDTKRLEPFVADVERAKTAAPVDRATWDGTPIGVAVDALLLERPSAEPGARWLAMITVHPASGTTALDAADFATRISLPTSRDARIGWLGVKEELDGLYGDYLDQALLQALLGSLAVLIVVALHLRSATGTLAVGLPLAAAVAVTLALLALAHQPLGILHLVGLLLVVAVGSNYALFFADADDRPDAETLASIVLANAATVISFTLIAFSEVGALAAIGRTVAPGAALALLFSAALARPGPSGMGQSAR